MSLIKSISGIRGTIGGVPGEGLSPVDVVKFTAAYADFTLHHSHFSHYSSGQGCASVRSHGERARGVDSHRNGF